MSVSDAVSRRRTRVVQRRALGDALSDRDTKGAQNAGDAAASNLRRAIVAAHDL
jgi:hypothetical protein